MVINEGMMETKKQFGDAYYSADTEKEQARTQAICERLYDDRFDEEVIFKKSLNLKGSHIALFDNCDLHIGGQGFDAKRLQIALQTEYKFFNGIMGIGGDVVDNANVNGKTNVYTAKTSPQDTMIGARELLKPYDYAFVMGGNHSAVWGVRNKDSNLGMDENLASMQGIDYARYTISLTLNILEPDTCSPKKMVVCIRHEVKNPQAYINFLLAQGICPDVIIREHTHDGKDGIYMTQVPVYKKGVLIGYENHSVRVVTGKSMQNNQTMYGGVKGFLGKTNVKGVLLSWERNPYYTAKSVVEPKYIAKVNVFDVLHKTKNEPSMFCKMLLRKYEKPSIETFKKQLSGKSFVAVSEYYSKFVEESQKTVQEYTDNLIEKKAEKKATRKASQIEEENENVR